MVRDVQLLQIERKAVTDYADAVGTVRALQTSALSAQTVGTIVSMHAQEGQRVHKGDVLIVHSVSGRNAAAAACVPGQP